MTMLIIRHLQTPLNQQKILQGQRDEEILTPSQSVKQSITQNQHIISQHAPFEKVLVSNLKRTLMTAQAYGYDASQCIIEPLLVELNFGPFEGKTKQDLLQVHGDQWVNDPGGLTLGEPLTELAERIRTFLQKYQHNNILVFGHGSWMRALISLHEQGDLSTMNKMTIANNQLFSLAI